MMTTGRERQSQFDIALGQRLRQLRLARNMTLEDLADRMGLSYQQIQKYETGRNAIASSRMEALCKALDITPDQLYEIDNVSAKHISSLSHYAIKTAQRLDRLSPEQKRVVSAMLTSWGVDEND